MATIDVRSAPLLTKSPEPTQLFRGNLHLQIDRIREVPESHESGPINVPTEEHAFISDTTLRDLIDPHNLNDAQLQDIYQLRHDDFEVPAELEVWYMQKGRAVKEYLFVDPLHSEERPRLCVSVKAVQAMHRAIAVLTRKVDNLVLTLRSCRQHYHKELCLLRDLVHRRDTGKDKIIQEDGTTSLVDHVALFFNPTKYQDEVSVQMFKQRIDEATYDMEQKLNMKNAEIRKLHQKIDKMENGLDRLDQHDARDLEEQIAELTHELENTMRMRESQEEQLEENEEAIAKLHEQIKDLKEEINLARGLVDKKEDKYNKAMEREHKEKVKLEKLLEQERQDHAARWDLETAIWHGEKVEMEGKIQSLTEKLAAARSSEERQKAKLARTIASYEEARSAVSFAPLPLASPAASRSSSPSRTRNAEKTPRASRRGDPGQNIDANDHSDDDATHFKSVPSDIEVQELRERRKTTLKEDLKGHLDELRRKTISSIGTVSFRELQALEAEVKDIEEVVEKPDQEQELLEIERLWEQVYKKPAPSLEPPKTTQKSRRSRSPRGSKRKTVAEKQVQQSVPLKLEDYAKLEPAELHRRLMLIANALGEGSPKACLNAVQALLGYMTLEERMELRDFLPRNSREASLEDDEITALMKRPFGTRSPRHDGDMVNSGGNLMSSTSTNKKQSDVSSPKSLVDASIQKLVAQPASTLAGHASQELTVPADELLSKWGKGVGSQRTTAQSTGVSVAGEFSDSRGRDALTSAGSFATAESRSVALKSAGSIGTDSDLRRQCDLDSRESLDVVGVGLESQRHDVMVRSAGSIGTDSDLRGQCDLDSRESLGVVGVRLESQRHDVMDARVSSVQNLTNDESSPARLAAILHDERLGTPNKLSRSASVGARVSTLSVLQNENFWDRWDGKNPPLLGSDGKVLVRRKSLPPDLFKTLPCGRSCPKTFSPKNRQPKRRQSLGPCWSAPMHVDALAKNWGTGLGRLSLSRKELPTRHNQVTAELLSAGWTLYDPEGTCYSYDVDMKGKGTRENEEDATHNVGIQQEIAQKALESGWSQVAPSEGNDRNSMPRRQDAPKDLMIAGWGLADTYSSPSFQKGPPGLLSAREHRRTSVLHGITNSPFRRKIAGQAMTMLKRSGSALPEMEIVGLQGVRLEGKTTSNAFEGNNRAIFEEKPIYGKEDSTYRESRQEPTFKDTTLHKSSSSSSPVKSVLRRQSSMLSVNELSFGGLAAASQNTWKQQEGDRKRKGIPMGTQTTVSVIHGSHFEVLPDREDSRHQWRCTSTAAEKEALRKEIARELLMLCLEMRAFAGLDSAEAPRLSNAAEEILIKNRQTVEQSSQGSSFILDASLPRLGETQTQQVARGNTQMETERRTSHGSRKRFLCHPSATSPISEMEDEDQRISRTPSTVINTKSENREVHACGATLIGDGHVQAVSQDLCVCGSLLRPDALFCRTCGLTRPEIARRNCTLGVTKANLSSGSIMGATASNISNNIQSASSLAFSDTDGIEGEGYGSQATLSTAASASSIRGSLKMKAVDSVDTESRVDAVLGTSLGIDTKPTELVATQEATDDKGVSADSQIRFTGPALSARTLIKPIKQKRIAKPLLQTERQKGSFANIIDAMMVDTGEDNSTSKPHLKALDDDIIARSKVFLDHDRRVSGRGPLEPRPPDRPQTQRQPRLKPLESPFAEQDLTKWNPETSRSGISALPLQALLRRK